MNETDYGTAIRRELHMHPELGYELPYTLGVVRRELTAFGIPFTERYGKSSIVATVGEGLPGKALAIRADMDALPILEANDVPYKSLTPGQMHACGHDFHTTILLDTARKLSLIRDRLTRPVKLIFQPAEEAGGGARRMVEDGVMEDVEESVALHVNPRECGTAQFHAGPGNSAIASMTLKFHGKANHSSQQEGGADAIMMAIQCYNLIENYIAKCFGGNEMILFNAGRIEGGEKSNIIAEECIMQCSARAFENENLTKLTDKIREIVTTVPPIYGGTGEMDLSNFDPVLVHDPEVTAYLKTCAEEVLGADKVYDIGRVLASEDYAYMAQKVPSCMMRFGVGNKEKDMIYGVHTNRFDGDERGITLASDIFVHYLLKKMGVDDGIPAVK